MKTDDRHRRGAVDDRSACARPRLLRAVHRRRGATLERRLARDSPGGRLRGHQLARARVGARPPAIATCSGACPPAGTRSAQAPRFEQVAWDNFGNGSLGGEPHVRARPAASSSNFRGRSSATARSRATTPSHWQPFGRRFAKPRFEDINWASHGSRSAARHPRRTAACLAANWSEARRESRFEDIDWDELVDDRDLPSSRYAGGFGAHTASPFGREEASVMSQVWGRIRTAAEFDDINWRDVGLSGPPGNREARRLMATHWGQLREAARFEDIDWAATTGTRSACCAGRASARA